MVTAARKLKDAYSLVTDSMEVSLSELWELVKDREAWLLQFMGSQRVGHA